MCWPREITAGGHICGAHERETETMCEYVWRQTESSAKTWTGGANSTRCIVWECMCDMRCILEMQSVRDPAGSEPAATLLHYQCVDQTREA